MRNKKGFKKLETTKTIHPDTGMMQPARLLICITQTECMVRIHCVRKNKNIGTKNTCLYKGGSKWVYLD